MRVAKVKGLRHSMTLGLVVTQCPHCRQCRTWTKADRLMWLQRSGFLRKQKDPGEEVVAEMFRLKLQLLPCLNCQKPGVREASQSQNVENDDEQWDTSPSTSSASAGERYCADCREQIDPDRIELFPEVTRCVICQLKFETGQSSGSGASAEACDLCPRCGDFLQTLRNRSSRVAYRVQCRSCGYSPKR